MPLAKLTLTADKSLVEEAKRVAAAKGTSLSAMVSRFLQSVVRNKNEMPVPGPVTQDASGLIEWKDEEYRDVLEQALLKRYGSDE